MRYKSSALEHKTHSAWNDQLWCSRRAQSSTSNQIKSK